METEDKRKHNINVKQIIVVILAGAVTLVSLATILNGFGA